MVLWSRATQTDGLATGRSEADRRGAAPTPSASPHRDGQRRHRLRDRLRHAHADERLQETEGELARTVVRRNVEPVAVMADGDEHVVRRTLGRAPDPQLTIERGWRVRLGEPALGVLLGYLDRLRRQL